VFRRSSRAGDGPLAGLLIVLFVLSTVAACGKKGPPRPPDPRGPMPPTGVKARQIGDKVDVYFDVPDPRGDKPGQALLEAELLRVAYAEGLAAASDSEVFRRRGEVVNAAGAERFNSGDRGRLADITLDQLEASGVGSTLRYAVRVRDQRDRYSAVVVATDLIMIEPRPAPAGLSAEPTIDGVRLVWEPVEIPPEYLTTVDADAGPTPQEPGQRTVDARAAETREGEGALEGTPAGDEAVDIAEDTGGTEGTEDTGEAPVVVRTMYNLYRALPGEPVPETPIHPLPLTDAEYLDADVVLGSRHVYYLRLLLSPGLPTRESRSSPGLEVLVTDRIAPDVPEALVAVQEGLAVRLFWRPNRDRDLAGYRVYRTVDDGPARQIGRDPLDQPTLLDEDVTLGQRVRYSVTAIDRATPPNESDRSASVTVTIQAEPEPAEEQP